MPVYEYRCNDCGLDFEQLFLTQRKAEAKIRCPSCESVDLRRLISAPAVRRSGADSREVSEETAPERAPLFGRKELEALKGK